MKRAATLAASALSLLSLATLTACGGGTEPDDAAGEPGPSASRPEQVPPARRLTGLMVTSADVDGFSVEKYGDEFALAKSPAEVTLDKPVCAPLAYAMNQLPLGEPRADLTRVLADKAGGLNSAHTYLTLTAHASGGAQSAMAGVRKALAACGDGFTAEGSGGTSTYDSVTTEDVAPAGDETLGFRSAMTFRGASHTLHTQVVRSGDVLGVYFSVNGMAIADARPSEAKLPPAVVKAQNAKLG
ncbi:hypothetical protein [Streptomyces sp. enrichment culture]|uniref:hypothetical protein n=1 Tax=Streptomyces sp. enrichment culture TaxID=1795815 RepID=UPI003F546F43